MIRFSAVLLFALFPVLLHAEENPLSTLRPEHPRILITPATVNSLQQALVDDPVLQSYRDRLLRQAEEMLNEPLPVYEKPDGFRLLPVSRTVRKRVAALALAWRLTGNEAYADRARADLLAVAAFPDWNPVHFLDTAEMAAGVGTGLDALWSHLSEADRTLLHNAIRRHALLPYLATHTAARYGSSVAGVGWVDKDTNWNAVCNGGILIAALAVADPDDLVSMNDLRAVLAATRSQLPLTLKSYAPDGAYPEGVMYWQYGSYYLAMTLDALQNALGNDLGLLQTHPGLAHTGSYILHAHGPKGWPLTYADANSSRRSGSHSAARLYFARRFNSPLLANLHHLQLGLPESEGRITAWDLLWYSPADATAAPPSRDAFFRGPTPLAVWRSAWNDPEALYVSMIGGDNPGPHGHLDLGSFELRALGERWFIDHGKDDYGLPGYWETNADGRRWTYFVLGSQGHSVPMINGAQQRTPARADFTHFAGGDTPGAILDLSNAYAPASFQRGVRLLHNRRSALIQDWIENATGPVRWGASLNPEATAVIDGNVVTLSLNGKSLRVHALTPEPVTWALRTIPDQPAGSKTARGGSKLEFTLPASKDKTPIAVWFEPVGKEPLTPPELQTQPDWEEMLPETE